MLKRFFKKLVGLQAIEDAKIKAQAEVEVAEKLAAQKLQEVIEAEEKARVAKLTPKELATEKGEPWVAVLDTHVNEDNIRNGFFELDWNEHFIVELKKAGYGYDGDPDEEIVDRWFRDLAKNMLEEAGISEPERVNAGFINVHKINKNRSEIS
jgi:alkylation response protein AidB-like acyl-CoA dehydrogenase